MSFTPEGHEPLPPTPSIVTASVETVSPSKTSTTDSDSVTEGICPQVSLSTAVSILRTMGQELESLNGSTDRVEESGIGLVRRFSAAIKHVLGWIIVKQTPEVPDASELTLPQELLSTQELLPIPIVVRPPSEDEQPLFIEFLGKLIEEILGVLASPKELAPIFVELMIISPTLILCWRVIKRIENLAQNLGRKLGSKDPVDKLIEEMGSDMGEILAHFRNDASKGRLAEISAATGISKEEVRLLLKVMAFEHQPDCRWQPPKPIADFLANELKSEQT